MDGTVLQQIKEALIARLQKIESSRIRPVDTENEVPLAQAEIIDIAQTLEQIGRDTTLREAERREFLAIEHALSKMSGGTFGICEECGEDIPARRLLVLPEARLCANCQAFEERQNGRFRYSGIAAR